MSNRIFLPLAAMLFFSMAACSQTQKEMEKTQVDPVFEVAVRMVKEGMKDDFVAKRAAFITQLKDQEGVSNDREFQSFYALPQPDAREVFIGMTQYESAATIEQVQGKIMEHFMPFAQTMDLKAYVFVQPVEGGDFDLSTLAREPGQVLELAVRRVKEGQQEAFDVSRKAFLQWLDAQEGVKGSWEFKVVAGQQTENLTVGVSVYESQEAFQKIAGQVQSSEAAGKYFSTFEPVALQYAFSTQNQ